MAEETQLAEAGQDSEKPEFDLLPAERAAVILLLLGEEQAQKSLVTCRHAKSKHLGPIW